MMNMLSAKENDHFPKDVLLSCTPMITQMAIAIKPEVQAFGRQCRHAIGLIPVQIWQFWRAV